MNLEYFDRKLQEAITAFLDDLYLKTEYFNNTHRLLILEHYGFDDHIEFENEINKSFGGQLENIFSNCNPKI